MPVFLERHDYFKVTATDFARIHLKDLEIQQEFGCWVLAYWCDVKRKTTFCLIDAPNLESVKKMHCHEYLSDPGQIMQIEEDLIDFFLGHMENPTPSVKRTASHLAFQKHELYAVMVLRLHGSDPRPLKDDAAGRRIFGNFKDCTQKIARKNKGKKITAACDSSIYFFDSFSRSVRCALQILDELEVQKNTPDANTLKVSIGLDGSQIDQKFELLEDTVTLANRLCRIAGRNQILVSAKVMDQIERDMEILENKGKLRTLGYKDEQFLTSLMDIIESNYRDDLKIGDFCKKMGKSRSQLYRKIIEVTNLPPIELINEFRLNKSLEMMRSQNGNNISQIAFEAGFNSLSYFSRKFKKRYGFLPSSFLNRT